MNTEQLATMTIEQFNDTVIVRISGELDSSNAKTIGYSIDENRSGARVCVVDLSLLTYLDSAALTMLHRLAQVSTGLHIVAPEGSRSGRLIEIGGLDTILITHQTLEIALLSSEVDAEQLSVARENRSDTNG